MIFIPKKFRPNKFVNDFLHLIIVAALKFLIFSNLETWGELPTATNTVLAGATMYILLQDWQQISSVSIFYGKKEALLSLCIYSSKNTLHFHYTAKVLLSYAP